MTAEDPTTVHGRLKEAIHISGYTFERACGELEWLLDDNRWQQAGPGFTNINAFLATVDLSEFRVALEQRKKLAAKLAALKASQSQTARTFGVDEGTIRYGLGKKNSENSEPQKDDRKNTNKNTTEGVVFSENSDVAPAWFERDASGLVQTAKTRAAIEQKKHARFVTPIPMPPGVFQVIAADPPWSYRNAGLSQSAETQYGTMSNAGIANLELPRVADDAVVFLWATSPLLPDAIAVLTAWGFEYKASLVWRKNRAPSLGWFVQTYHELLLIGVRGDAHPAVKVRSVFTADVTKHSAKPDRAYELIEEMYPTWNRIELFGRAPRPGWIVWGDQVSDVREPAQA